jgi:hypothetical protein
MANDDFDTATPVLHLAATLGRVWAVVVFLCAERRDE